MRGRAWVQLISPFRSPPHDVGRQAEVVRLEVLRVVHPDEAVDGMSGPLVDGHCFEELLHLGGQ